MGAICYFLACNAVFDGLFVCCNLSLFSFFAFNSCVFCYCFFYVNISLILLFVYWIFSLYLLLSFMNLMNIHSPFIILHTKKSFSLVCLFIIHKELSNASTVFINWTKNLLSNYYLMIMWSMKTVTFNLNLFQENLCIDVLSRSSKTTLLDSLFFCFVYVFFFLLWKIQFSIEHLFTENCFVWSNTRTHVILTPTQFNTLFVLLFPQKLSNKNK